MGAFLGFVELYVSPFFIAIGLAFTLNGVFNYFILGVMGLEEDRREIGRQSLLWAILFFLTGLCIYALSTWVVSLVERVSSEVDDAGSVEVQQGPDVLRIPNVPGVE